MGALDEEVIPAPNGRGGHPVLDDIQKQFVNMLGAYPDNGYPVHVRWSIILLNLPQIVGRKLYENLNDIYHWAWFHATGGALIAVMDLLRLQARFLEALYQNGMILPHAYAYNICSLQSWHERLLPRFNETVPWRRGKWGQVKKERIPPPPKVLKGLH